MPRLPLAVLGLAASTAARGAKCPGSPAFVHAKCQLAVSFPASCAAVSAEVQARVAGEGGWKDPHNNGRYSLLSMAGGDMELKRVTGNGQYTDRITFVLAAEGAGCRLEACSESQVTSVLDFSTNYCNIRDLYCGSAEGCPVAKHELAGYTETLGSCRQHDQSKCVVRSEAAAPLPQLRAPAGSCPTVTTQPDFDLDGFISKRWYIQQQMPVLYLPVAQNYCVYAEYAKMAKPSLLGYTIQVHNHAEEADGKVHDSGSFICAKSGDASDPAKLEVGPCFLPSVGGLVTGPYWVLAYGEDEGYALISGGQPTHRASGGCRTGSFVNGAGLWIFTRQQQRDEALVQKVRAIAASKGFDLGVLNDVDQTRCSEALQVHV